MSATIETIYPTEGMALKRIQLTNQNGIRVSLLSLGCAIESIETEDKSGNRESIVLRWDNPLDYIENGACIGALVGRTAGRTGRATFTVDGNPYHLDQNSGPNSIHGGFKGFHRRIWDAEIEGETAAFRYESPDGEGGYPGNLVMEARFTLTESNQLIQELRGWTDVKTWINPTNHSYFNLSGTIQKPVSDHLLEIDGAYYHPVDENGLPEGQWMPVNGTAFDFTSPKLIEGALTSNHAQINQCRGIDHPFKLNPEGGIRLTHPQTGRTLTVYTDCPAVVVYTGNYLEEARAHNGETPFGHQTGICFETQSLPDAVNRPGEALQWVTPETPWYSKTIFEFGILD